MAPRSRSDLNFLSPAVEMVKWWSAPDSLRAEGSFLRSALALISGTVASQAILFLFSPLLSRIFDPADFGNLANYNAWVAILSMLSNLRYEHAMIVVSGRAGMNRVIALAIALSTVAFLAYGVIAGGIYLAAPATGYLGEIRGIVVFIALGTLPTVISSLLIQFNIRKGGFKTIAVVSLIQVICTLAVQVLLGVFHVENALVAGAFIGTVVACTIFLAIHLRRNSLHHIRREMSFSRLQATASEHVNFPRYTLATDAINIVVQQFVPVFLTGMFGPAVAGLYAFSTRVVRVPLLVVATSVATVLRKEAGDHLRRNGNLVTIFRRTVGGLALVAIGPFALLMLFATDIFSRVFGQKWVEAGPIVRILGPGLMVEFIAVPLVALFLVTQTQRFTFRIQLAGIALLFTALVAGRYYWNSFLATCVLMSIAMVISNGSTLVAAFAVSKPHRRLAVEALVQ